MATEHDDAFRRFLERATADPPEVAGGGDGELIDLVPLARSRSAAGARSAPARPRARGRAAVLAAAAVLVVAAGGLLLRPDGSRVAVAPSASTDPAAVPSTGPVPTGGPSTTAAAPPTLDPAATGSVPGLGTGPDGAAVSTVVGVGQVATLPPPEAATTTTGAAGSTGTSALPSPAVRLDLGLDSVAVDSPDGAAISPGVGPALRLERAGAGSIEAVAGGGRRFLPGGQQRTDHVVVTRVGADVGDLVAPTGRATLVLVPLVDVAQRTTPTGRNIHTWFEIVSREGPDDLVTGLMLQVDPEIGPYFGGAVNGTGFSHVLTADEVGQLGAGREVTVALEWTPTTGRVVLNGRTLTEFPLTTGPIGWTGTARLSIGGSASWGAGYFSAHDDALRSFQITAG